MILWNDPSGNRFFESFKLLFAYYTTSHCYNYLNFRIILIGCSSVTRVLILLIFFALPLKAFSRANRMQLLILTICFISYKYWSMAFARRRKLLLEWNLDASLRSLANAVAKQVHDYLHKSFLIRVNASRVFRIKIIGNVQLFHLTNTTVNINTVLQQIINWECRKIYLTLFNVHLRIVYQSVKDDA